MRTAPVNKIILFSNVDGPGNRTSVFFQGCNFACRFCHNPETMHLCDHCGACVPVCPAGALRWCDPSEPHEPYEPSEPPEPSEPSGRKVVWDPAACRQCDACLKACPRGASPRIRWMTAEEVCREIARAFPYIDGITVSGGECTLQAEFLLELFPMVRAAGKTCLLDSNGSFDFEADPRLLAVSDGVMLDVKAVNPAWSRFLLGVSPDRVLKNLDFLLRAGRLQEVRTVILPGRDAENGETVRYVAGKIGPACDYKIIRYRPFGVRPEQQRVLGEEETAPDYAERFAALARSLGAEKAFVV